MDPGMANVDKKHEEQQPKPQQPTPAEIEHDELDHKLDEALDLSFPASDPISIGSHDG
jgi:hypothetical protein